MSPEENDREPSAPRKRIPKALEEFHEKNQMPARWHQIFHGRQIIGEDEPTGTAPSEGKQQHARDVPKRIPPPRLFREVASRLGFTPPNNPPSPPRIELDDDLAPASRPTDFWNPEEDGGAFGERASLEIGLPERLGESPRINEEADTPPRTEPGQDHGFTVDVVAYYHPWHIGGDEHWGIYFRRKQMDRYVQRTERLFGWNNLRDVVTEQILQHETEHFEQEKAVFALEDALDKGELRSKWVQKRKDIVVNIYDREKGQVVGVKKIQEALATAREIEWARRQEGTGYCPPGYADFLDWDSRSAPTGYRSFYLCLGWLRRRTALAGYLESVASAAEPALGTRLTGETARLFFGERVSTKDHAVPVYLVNN